MVYSLTQRKLDHAFGIEAEHFSQAVRCAVLVLTAEANK
jgi:hypothetical protein